MLQSTLVSSTVLWDWKSQELYSTIYDLLSDTVRETKVRKESKKAFLAYLSFINGNDKKHRELKTTLANNHANGEGEAYPSSCHAALTQMNDFKPMVIEGTTLMAAQGTAFAQKQKGVGAQATGKECNYNKEYFANMEWHNCVKKGHVARCWAQKKNKSKKGTEWQEVGVEF